MNDALFGLIRPHYRTLQGYVSAGMESGKDETKIFMNANENPYELPGLEGYNRYPEPQPPKLLSAYADLYGVRPEHIVATRGADEAIVVLTKLFCEPDQDAVLICPPTFGMYAVDARAMPADVAEVPLVKTESGSFALDAEGIKTAAQEKAVKLVFLCSPNNPTGTSFPHAEILDLCKELEGQAVIILDETYAEFSQAGSLSGKLNDHPNLVILRTLSKSYSLAGMRMGTLLSGDENFIALIRSKCLDAYPLPKASIDAALKVMSPALQETAGDNRRKLLAARDRLMEEFRQNPLVRYVYPSDANFFLVKMDRAKDFLNHCAEHNIILRDFTGKALTKDCIRVSIGLPEENEKLLTLLSNFAQESRKNSAA